MNTTVGENVSTQTSNVNLGVEDPEFAGPTIDVCIALKFAVGQTVCLEDNEELERFYAFNRDVTDKAPLVDAYGNLRERVTSDLVVRAVVIGDKGKQVRQFLINNNDHHSATLNESQIDMLGAQGSGLDEFMSVNLHQTRTELPPAIEINPDTTPIHTVISSKHPMPLLLNGVTPQEKWRIQNGLIDRVTGEYVVGLQPQEETIEQPSALVVGIEKKLAWQQDQGLVEKPTQQTVSPESVEVDAMLNVKRLRSVGQAAVRLGRMKNGLQQPSKAYLKLQARRAQKDAVYGEAEAA